MFHGDAREQKQTVLVIDDTKENLTLMGQLLQPLYQVRVASTGQRGLRAAQNEPRPDLILLDVMMPELDGYGVLHELKQSPLTCTIPVIFVTAMGADEDEERGLSLGAVDYVTKPIRPAILLARVQAQLELKRSRDLLAWHNEHLEQEVARRTAENELIKDVSLYALAMLAEKRDNETGNHLKRTRAYVETLMAHLKDHPRFAELQNEAHCQRIAKAAPLHDIGKVGIPDGILLKPGKLLSDEFEIMKTHAAIGEEALTEAIERVQLEQVGRVTREAPLAFLDAARQIAGGHHERWDGSGYPRGLRGDAIPVPARLMALADVFDALVSKRHYKEAFPISRAVELIQQGRGSHFDPDIVDAFLKTLDAFVAIAEQYRDPDPDLP